MELIPYTGSPPATIQPLQPGTIQGVMITSMDEDAQKLNLLGKIRAWFANRPEVNLVDYGYTDKQGLLYIILEWDGYAVDPLFIAILEEESLIEDYTVYTRGG